MVCDGRNLYVNIYKTNQNNNGKITILPLVLIFWNKGEDSIVWLFSTSLYPYCFWIKERVCQNSLSFTVLLRLASCRTRCFLHFSPTATTFGGGGYSDIVPDGTKLVVHFALRSLHHRRLFRYCPWRDNKLATITLTSETWMILMLCLENGLLSKQNGIT